MLEALFGEPLAEDTVMRELSSELAKLSETPAASATPMETEEGETVQVPASPAGEVSASEGVAGATSEYEYVPSSPVGMKDAEVAEMVRAMFGKAGNSEEAQEVLYVPATPPGDWEDWI